MNENMKHLVLAAIIVFIVVAGQNYGGGMKVVDGKNPNAQTIKIYPIEDAMVHSGINVVDWNYGAFSPYFPGLHIGANPEKRSYLMFDVSLVENKEIISAELNYLVNGMGGTGGRDLKVALHHVLVDNWVEGVGNQVYVGNIPYTEGLTWNNQPCWDLCEKEEAYVRYIKEPGWVTFNANSIVKEDRDGKVSVVLVPKKAKNRRSMAGFSKEFIDITKRPYLKITFI